MLKQYKIKKYLDKRGETSNMMESALTIFRTSPVPAAPAQVPLVPASCGRAL